MAEYFREETHKDVLLFIDNIFRCCLLYTSSAIIVAIAISMPAIKEKIAFEQRKHGACRRRVTTGKEGK